MREIAIRTARRTQLVDVTEQVQKAVEGATGSAVLLYVPHTTAGVMVNERADPMVARDFETALERIVDDDWTWKHVELGEENAPSHVRAALMGTQAVIPLDGGRLALGTWQGVFFCEFDGPRDRTIYVTTLA